MKLNRTSVLLVVSILLSGCYGPVKDDNLVTKSYEAADSLLIISGKNKSNHQVVLDDDKPIVVASFVNIDNMLESSRLGRIIAEQVASRMSQQGYYVVELKLRKNIFIKEQTGELLLSREVKEVSKTHGAQAVVIGTYAAGKEYVYISLRIVTPENNKIIASYDYRLPIGADTQELLELKSENKGSRSWR